MVDVIYADSFKKSITKIKDKMLLTRVKNNIIKIVNTPDIGKPLKYDLKGERSVRVKPFRIIYSYTDDTVTFLVFEHRSSVYD